MNGGRWTSEGVPVVYLASTLALAALEYLVHVDIEDVPDDLVALRLYIPDDCTIDEVDATQFGADWNTTASPICIQLGDEWVRDGRSLLLKVPSALLPEDSNILMNPTHPEAGQVDIRTTRPFAFDPRLLA
jgi:RES domain-containing protein